MCDAKLWRPHAVLTNAPKLKYYSLRLMKYISIYKSPLGNITLASDGSSLTGLWFDEQKYDRSGLDADAAQTELPVFRQTKQWLDVYFSGHNPNFTPPIKLSGTRFQNLVAHQMLEIKFGHTATYGEIAQQIAIKLGRSHMSARAVGGAVGKNRISLIIPCHRVVGKSGHLTGYAGGVDKKLALMRLEGIDIARRTATGHAACRPGLHWS